MKKLACILGGKSEIRGAISDLKFAFAGLRLLNIGVHEITPGLLSNLCWFGSMQSTLAPWYSDLNAPNRTLSMAGGQAIERDL
jgi:hypothetical protein